MTWLAYSHLGVAKTVQLTTQPAGASAGLPFGTQPVGRLVDGSGVPSRATGVTVTASKASGTGTLSGTLSVQTVEGVFTFTDLAMSTATAAVTLQFASSGLTSATSSSFNVTTSNVTMGAESGAYALTGTSATLTHGTENGVLLFAESFESGTLTGWFDDSTVPIAGEARPGSSGVASVALAWAASATSPTGVAACRRSFTPSESVYLSYWVMHSTNWVGSGQSYHPHVFHFLTDVDDVWIGPSVTHLTTYDEMLYTGGGMIYQMALQDSLNIDTNNLLVDLTGVTENRAVCGYNGQPETGFVWDTYDNGGGDYRNYKILQTAQVISDATKNDWHHIESFRKMNSIAGGIGQPDGVMRLWVDDVLVVDRADVYFRTNANPTMKFETFVMAPYIQDGSPVAQTMWVDDVAVWTAKPPESTYFLAAAAGDYTITGSAASLSFDGDVILNTVSGSYALTGSAVGLTYVSVSGNNPNEPVGYTEVTNTGLSSGTEDGWHIESGTPTFTTDSTAPVSPSAIARATYPAGFTSGSPPWGIDYTLPGGKTALYYNLVFKLSSNFEGENSGTNKLGFVWIHDNPSVFLSAEGVNSGTLVAHLRLQNVPDARDHLTPNVGPSGAISRGVWHQWEVQLVSNTAGNADGVARCWLDGVKITEYTNVQFATSGQSKTWQIISLYPIWGGTGDTVSSTMSIDFDNYYVSAP